MAPPWSLWVRASRSSLAISTLNSYCNDSQAAAGSPRERTSKVLKKPELLMASGWSEILRYDYEHPGPFGSSKICLSSQRLHTLPAWISIKSTILAGLLMDVSNASSLYIFPPLGSTLPRKWCLPSSLNSNDKVLNTYRFDQSGMESFMNSRMPAY